MSSGDETDRLITYAVIGIIVSVGLVFLIINLTSSSFSDPKSTDFDFVIEQIYMKRASPKELDFYKSSNPSTKLKMLEDFKRFNPDAVRTAMETTGYNTSSVIVNDPVVKDLVSNSNDVLACKSVVAKTLSMPIPISLEVAPKVIKKLIIQPQISMNNDGVVVDVERSIMVSLSRDTEFHKFNASSKGKLINLLKEKIISDINSKYKKASVSLSFDRLKI